MPRYCVEVLQRGVLVNEKILPSWMPGSTEGKPIEGSVPKQILAGSAVMAEDVPKAVQEVGQTLETHLMPRQVSKDVRSQEERLKIMLHLATPTTDDEPPITRQSQLLLIAEGFYYRAAFFQPDVPPMWKRAWDVIRDRKRAILEQQSNGDEDTGANKDVESASWESATALTNLRRITFTKGNSKRAAELSLLLVESLLDAHRQTRSSNQQSRPLCHHFDRLNLSRLTNG
jgi:hypothetical protein